MISGWPHSVVAAPERNVVPGRRPLDAVRLAPGAEAATHHR